MEAKEYYNALFEAEVAEATAKADVSTGRANKFIFYDGSKAEVIHRGSSWVPKSGTPAAGADYTPKYIKIENGNGWELGGTPLKIQGEIKTPEDALLHIIHSGMPISTPMSDSVINDIIGKIEGGRAKRGSNKMAINWMVDEDGKVLTMYACDPAAAKSFRNNLYKYKQKHGIELSLANLDAMVKNLQNVQKRINAVCNSTPKMSVEYAHSVADSIVACRKCNSFLQGMRSSTTSDKTMASLMLNNKLLANMADSKSMKDSFPNMGKRLMVIRKQMLDKFATDEITEKNQSKYRDILTALIDKDINPDPDLSAAEVNFGNKLNAIGMTPEMCSDKIYEEVFAKLDKFGKTSFNTEEEATATAESLKMEEGKLYNLGMINETYHKAYVNLLNNYLANKVQALRQMRQLEQPNEMPGDVETTSPAAAAGTSDVPSYSYYFLEDVKHEMKLDVPIEISLEDDKKKTKAWHSLISRMGKAGWECLGYRPQGYINNIINSYATTRDMRMIVPAGILQGSAWAINAVYKKITGKDSWFSNSNEERFKLSKWLREEVQTKAGEINPEVRKLEQHLANAPRSIGNGVRQLLGKEVKEKPAAKIDSKNFDMSELAPDRVKNATYDEGKYKGKSGHYKKSMKEKDFGKLTKECAEGGAAMAGATSAGDGFFQMPGSISSEGNPIAPTYTQTPFVNGVKTSTSDSGSGDKFQTTINKKKQKKNDEWYNRLEKLPDVQSFFDNWGSK